jgi:hypothetical protein
VAASTAPGRAQAADGAEWTNIGWKEVAIDLSS